MAITRIYGSIWQPSSKTDIDPNPKSVSSNCPPGSMSNLSVTRSSIGRIDPASACRIDRSLDTHIHAAFRVDQVVIGIREEVSLGAPLARSTMVNGPLRGAAYRRQRKAGNHRKALARRVGMGREYRFPFAGRSDRLMIHAVRMISHTWRCVGSVDALSVPFCLRRRVLLVGIASVFLLAAIAKRRPCAKPPR